MAGEHGIQCRCSLITTLILSKYYMYLDLFYYIDKSILNKFESLNMKRREYRLKAEQMET